MTFYLHRYAWNLTRRAWPAYRNCVFKYPWSTQIITTGVLMGAGDSIAQLLVERRGWKGYDVMPTLRFSFLGFVYVAPVVQAWYIFLQRRVKGHRLIIPLKMIAFDQLIFSPISLCVFLVLLRKLEQKSLSENIQLLKRDLIPIYTTGLEIWPFVQIIKFYIIPLNFRLVAAQAFALVWNTFVAFKSRADIKTES